MAHYIIDEHGYEREVSMDEYNEWRWSEVGRKRRNVGFTPVGDYTVSTVFIGHDMSHGRTFAPLLYETLVMRNLGWSSMFHPLSGYMETYYTWDEAIEGHEEMIELVREHMAALTMPSVPEYQAAIEHAMAARENVSRVRMPAAADAFYLTLRLARNCARRYPDLYRDALRCVMRDMLNEVPDDELEGVEPALSGGWGLWLCER